MAVASSDTGHSDEIRLDVPADRKERVKPSTSSPCAMRPSPDSQADSVTSAVPCIGMPMISCASRKFCLPPSLASRMRE